ncbi:MAG: helix-turn-helix domain-containing protein [Gemmatimonadota bacterium]
MKDWAFQEALDSARELCAAREGKVPPYKETVIEVPDVARVRAKMGLSQSEFAVVMGISKRTLQDWEQGRRVPTGPARSLLVVTSDNPQGVFKSVMKARRVKKPRKARPSVKRATRLPDTR